MPVDEKMKYQFEEDQKKNKDRVGEALGSIGTFLKEGLTTKNEVPVEPPKPVETEEEDKVATAVMAPKVATPEQADSDALRRELSQIQKERNAALKEFNVLKSELKNIPAGEQKDNFSKALEAAKEEYKQELGSIDNREALINIMHNISRLGAAMYGLKHGVDMSGLAFEKPKFDEEKNRTRGDYLEAIKDIRSQRENALRTAEKERDRAFREKAKLMDVAARQISNLDSKELKLMQMENRAAMNAMKKELKADTAAGKERAAKMAQLDKAENLINTAMLADKDTDKQKLLVQASNAVTRALGPDKAKEVVSKQEKGIWASIFGGEGELVQRDPEEAATKLSEARDAFSSGQKIAEQNTVPTYLRRKDPNTGKTALFDPETKAFIRFE